MGQYTVSCIADENTNCYITSLERNLVIDIKIIDKFDLERAIKVCGIHSMDILAHRKMI